MPLRKLWNSFRGEKAPLDQAAPEPQSPPKSTSSSASDGLQPQPVALKAPAKRSTSKRKSLSRDDQRWLDRLVKAEPHSILEIGIHDRSLDILDQLTRPGHSTPIRYIAVDEFEMGDSQVTLREYHQQLREFPAKAHLVPMPVQQGLQRVLTTYGQMDLVFWNHQEAPNQTQLQLLSRLAKPKTLLLTRTNDRWEDSLSQAMLDPVKRAA
ncbi:hypothetical protein SV7mr_06550 [Stieleria bergensis]|uniref:Uncharacterized protein n=1 Tax=Stieleria bergensis TaxID=2528025 RepID=A0A517SPW2_9BACT|nr:hypothetical protein SV7mr_06550 [Planctomycetes bacterium SV_7m_r]